MSRVYYTLAVREDGVWSPQFGAYDRADVVSERQEYRDNGLRVNDLRIVVSLDEQAAIDEAVRELNTTKV